MVSKTDKHDRYVDHLCKILESEYDSLAKNVTLYSRRKRKVAEIDILAFKNGEADIYEVKCSHRVMKAKKQLNKIRKIMPQQTKIRNSFFFCGESGTILLV